MITSFKLMQSLPHFRLLRLMPRGPMLGSDISHNSTEVERGTSAHSQLQLHRHCVLEPWPSPLSRGCTLAGCSIAENSGMVWLQPHKRSYVAKVQKLTAFFDCFIVPNALQDVPARSFSLCFPAWLANKETGQNPSYVLSCSERWCMWLWCSPKP